ncbi:transposase, partial [Escherichia coli]|nr:transposase [Escherichia coli]
EKRVFLVILFTSFSGSLVSRISGAVHNELYHIEEKIKNSEKLIQQLARDNSAAQLLMQFRGIGPMTATAIVASIGNGHDFKNGRQFSAWLGLTP